MIKTTWNAASEQTLAWETREEKLEHVSSQAQCLAILFAYRKDTKATELFYHPDQPTTDHIRRSIVTCNIRKRRRVQVPISEAFFCALSPALANSPPTGDG